MISFFSPSAIENMRAELGEEVLSRLGARAALAAVGPVTAAALRERRLAGRHRSAARDGGIDGGGDCKLFFTERRFKSEGRMSFPVTQTAPAAGAAKRFVPWRAKRGCRRTDSSIRCLCARARMCGIRLPRCPGVAQQSVDTFLEECREVEQLGIPGIILFGIPEKKDALGTEAYAADGVVQRADRGGSPRQFEFAGDDGRVPVRIHRPRTLRHRRKRGSEERSDAGIARGGIALARARRRRYHRAFGHDGRARGRDSQGARWRADFRTSPS